MDSRLPSIRVIWTIPSVIVWGETTALDGKVAFGEIEFGNVLGGGVEVR